MRPLLLLIACVFILSSCHKSHNGLAGQWKLVETFNLGQLWRPITDAQAQTLTFKSDNTYTLTTNMLSSFSGCTGTYKVENDMITLSPVCGSTPPVTSPLRFTISENILILDHLSTSAGVKTKYTRN